MAQSILNFFKSATIEIEINPVPGRAKRVIHFEDDKEELTPIFLAEENISGTVTLSVPPGKQIEHTGVKIELIGQIDFFSDKGGGQFEFLKLSKELLPSGILASDKKMEFMFNDVEKKWESYDGMDVRLRYFLRATVIKSYSNIVKESEFTVIKLEADKTNSQSIKMEVGIEECLHIEFEYNKSRYHLQDVVTGKVYFLLVNIKIKHMELAIMQRETAGTGTDAFSENQTIAKFEIMDGAPVKGESIPVRLYLGMSELTPTYMNVANKFSVKYFLNLVLVDEDDRRYFKQQEITLWRRDIE